MAGSLDSGIQQRYLSTHLYISFKDNFKVHKYRFLSTR
jgi:hypothetical protein